MIGLLMETTGRPVEFTLDGTLAFMGNCLMWGADGLGDDPDASQVYIKMYPGESARKAMIDAGMFFAASAKVTVKFEPTGNFPVSSPNQERNNHEREKLDL